MLAGGDCEKLFDVYGDMIRESNFDLDYKTLTVIYRDKSGEVVTLRGGIDVKETIGGALLGRRIQDEWRKALKGCEAAGLCEAESFAEEEVADLVCGNAR